MKKSGLIFEYLPHRWLHECRK